MTNPERLNAECSRVGHSSFVIRLFLPFMNHSTLLQRDAVELETRRFFLRKSMACIGGMAFATALSTRAGAAPGTTAPAPQFPAKAKRVIYIHLAGAPSHLETFDYKPELAKLDG